MTRLLTALLALPLFLGLAARTSAADDSSPPATPKKPVTDTYHGVKVTEDYRWLEDVQDPAVRRWIEAQNRHTRAALEQFPQMAALRKRVKELMTDESPDHVSLTYRKGVLFAIKSQPPKEQPFLITLKSADQPESAHVVVDPNQINAKGTTAINFYVPSSDGKLVAVSLSEGGSEEGSVSIYEVATGKKRPDLIPRVNYPTAGGSVAWKADGSGFYYTRYPRGDERPKEDLNFYQQVYFHKLGTPTAEDTYVLGKEFPRIAEISLETSDDGRHLLATVANGDGGEYAHYLMNAAGAWTQLTRFTDQVSAATFGPEETLYLLSRKGAPRGNLLRLSLKTPELAKAHSVVGEGEANIEGFAWTSAGPSPSIVATAKRLYVVDLIGGPSQVRSFDHDGSQPRPVPIPAISAVEQILALKGDDVLFRNESYLDPPAWYRFDPATEKVTRTALHRTSRADFSDMEVVRKVAISRDGTRVPLNIIHRKGLKHDGQNPTLLNGYGGFGISMTPHFKVSRRVWLEQGGVLAIANLRGGGEFGEDWHKNGSLTKKQNVFDDFTACAQYLLAEKYTNRDRLAIEGGSNGGLLMGALVTQHPELFRAVVAHVGLHDMLRFEQNPNGVFNVTEYGSVKDADQFKALHAYSPYHNVKDGTAYPAVFLLCGLNDGRVFPSDSWKMTARLQAATSSKRPILLWTKSGSGHGLDSSLSERVAEEADVYAFLFQQLGVKYRE